MCRKLLGAIPYGGPNVVREVYLCRSDVEVACDVYPPHTVRPGECYVQTNFCEPDVGGVRRWLHRTLCREHGAEFESAALSSSQEP